MLENKTVVDAVAAEAKELINALFTNPKPRVKTSAEEVNKDLAFDINKDGKDNYDFLTSKRISAETMHNYMAVVEEVMSDCPNLTEDNAETIVNLYANYLDITQKMYREHYGRLVSMHMINGISGIIHEQIMITAQIMNSHESFDASIDEVNDQIKEMMVEGTTQEKIVAASFSGLDNPHKVFGFLLQRFAKLQYVHITTRINVANPENHGKTLFHLNRIARNVCEVSCLIYSKIAAK
jgi:hypothetical protein